MAKRLFDVLASGLGLVMLSPLLVAIAVAVRLDSPGPALFHQERVGRYGRRFYIHKFRSMVCASSGYGPQITAAGDRRITRVGRWLRRCKLDELPQLLDVLAGHMSLVGPRPEVPQYVDLSNPDQQEILTVRPGITGPTQLRYRDEAALFPPDIDADAFYREHLLPRKILSDLGYVRQQPNWWGDVCLVLRTLRGASLPPAE